MIMVGFEHGEMVMSNGKSRFELRSRGGGLMSGGYKVEQGWSSHVGLRDNFLILYLLSLLYNLR
ncbi:hypothetical protein MtrunA17_Chr4g0002621 [Medicago truncatula]|uniref:Uncharacterized protein n=1 Tax=Medicago truncatula TaxID=3880 RepID=A0A396I2N7_MEDTR|nr:hypothetical protein MtrunA17_Chr4g0002621 [Medicago truncatula]